MNKYEGVLLLNYTLQLRQDYHILLECVYGPIEVQLGSDTSCSNSRYGTQYYIFVKVYEFIMAHTGTSSGFTKL